MSNKPGTTWMKGGQSVGTAHVVISKGTEHFVTLCGVVLSCKYAVTAMKYTSRCKKCLEILNGNSDRVGKIEPCHYCNEPYTVEYKSQMHCKNPFCIAERERIYQQARRQYMSTEHKITRAQA